MPDNHSPEVRSYNMSKIRSTNTVPEDKVRKYLFKKGYRYRKNDKKLPGHPDIVLKKYSTVIFVNGCFWHKHNCGKFVWPKTNTVYWTNKISRNVERDRLTYRKLQEKGWKVLIVWECEIGKNNFMERMELLESQIQNAE